MYIFTVIIQPLENPSHTSFLLLVSSFLVVLSVIYDKITILGKGQLISKCLFERARAETIKIFVGILVQTMIS